MKLRRDRRFVMDNFERASILSEALPYIREFSKQTVIVKYDSKVMQSESLRQAAISNIALLSFVGVRVVVIHGGGPENDPFLKALGKEQAFVDGQRCIDEETLDVTQMVSIGIIGKDIVTMITDQGGKAIGFSGLDGGLFTAKKLSGDLDFGKVGELTSINPELILVALDNGYIPVISAIARCETGGGSFKISADTAAAELAVKLGAKKLILLTDECGVTNEEGELISELTLSAVRPLIKKGAIRGKMIHRVNCCVKAVRRGVPRAHILDGSVPHSILIEVLTDSGIGTMIVQD